MLNHRALAVIALALGCEPATFRTAVKSPTEAEAPPPRVSRTVTIGDNFFSPNPLTVPVGTRVFWTHNGVDFHSVSFDPPISFFSGQMGRSDQVQRQFQRAGVYTYRCTFHANMIAVLHVQEAE